MLIWLASYPRSGNTLLRMTLERSYGMHTCSVYRESASDGPELVDLIEASSPEVVLRQIDSDPQPHFLKTHEPAGYDSYPCVYLVRDGRDALVSFAHFLIDYVIGKDDANAEFQYWQTLNELIATPDRYGGWSHNVRSWVARPNTILVRYEELIVDPVQSARCVLRQLDLLPGGLAANASAPDFAALQQASPRFYRRGTTGTWREDMDELLEDFFWRENGATMASIGYERGSR